MGGTRRGSIHEFQPQNLNRNVRMQYCCCLSEFEFEIRKKNVTLFGLVSNNSN